MTDIKTISV